MAEVDIKLNLDAKEAVSGVKSFGASISSAFGSLKDSIFSVQGLLVGAVGVLAGRQLISGLESVTEAASVQDDAINKLNTALRLSGDYSIESSQDMQNFASELQKTSIIGDETTLSMLALAKSFGASNEQAKDLVQAASELSAATGVSLDSAVETLGKTLQGSVGLLGRSVPGLKNLSEEALKSGAAIDFINQRFGGSAASQINTFSGATTQLSNTFGDLKEQIGFIITQNPAVIAAVKTLTVFFENVGSAISGNKDVASDFIGSIIEGIVRNIPVAIRQFSNFVDSLEPVIAVAFAIKDAFNTVFDFLGNVGAFVISGIVLEISGLKAAVLGIVSVASQGLNIIGIVSDETAAKLKKDFEEAESDMIAASQTAEIAFKNILNVGNEDSSEAFLSTINGLHKIRDGADAAAKAADDAVANFSKFKASAGKGVEINIKGGKVLSDEVNKDLEDLKKQAAEFATQLQRAGLSGEEAQRFDISQTLEKNLIKIREFADKGAISIEQATEFSLLAIENSQKEIAKIEDAANQKRIAAIKEFAINAADLFRRGLFSLGSSILSGLSGISTDVDISKSLKQQLKDINDAVVSGNLSAEEAATKRFEVEAKAQEDLSKLQEQNITKVAETFSSQIGGILDEVLPGLGGFASSVLGVLTAAPEVLDKQIDAFVSAIPGVLNRIIENIPVLLKALAEGFIENVVKALPKIIDQLAKIVPQLLISLTEAITDPEFIDAFVAAAGNFVRAIIKATPTIVTALVRAIPTVIRALAKEIAPIIVELAKALGPIIKEIALAIPDILVALAEAVPVIIQGLIAALPEIIPPLTTGLIQAIPEIVAAFIYAIPDIVAAFAAIFAVKLDAASTKFLLSIAAAPNKLIDGLQKGFQSFIEAFLAIPETFLQSLILGLQNGLDAIFSRFKIGGGGGGNIIGNITGGVKLPKLASGGTVPKGFPNDTFPASLSSGELVVPRDDASKLSRFLDQNDGSSLMPVLIEIANLLSQPMQVQTRAEVNGNALADIMLNLSRNGARLTA